MRLAIILYSYHKRLDRQRVLAKLSYHALSACPGVEVFVTTRAGYDDGEPACFRRIPLDVPDGYEYLPDKTIAMFRWLLEHGEFDYVVKCDDDVFLDAASIRRLDTFWRLPDYVGAGVGKTEGSVSPYHRGRCVTPALNDADANLAWAGDGIAFATGTCYGLSVRAVAALLAQFDRLGFSIPDARNRFDVRGVGAEDILVAWLLRECGIHPQECLRLIHGGCRRDLAAGLIHESLVRARLRSEVVPSFGVCCSNRMPSWPECVAIGTWFRLSAMLPPCVVPVVPTGK